MSMKKTVLAFGLIGGAVSTGMMVLGLMAMERIGAGRAELLGYTAIVLSALLVFFGVRSYRDRVAGGRVTFGRAFAVGLLITLVSSTCYVATWELMYFHLVPGIGDKVAACMIERVRTSGAGQEKVDEMVRQTETFKRLWDNPLTNAAVTFVEPFPIGAVASLISAAILRRRG
jgi:hypothetical protein